MFLSVAPVAIELTKRLCVLIERGGQNRVFVGFRRFADLDERKLRRAAFVAQGKPHGVLQAPARATITRRLRLQPVSRTSLSFASKPWPASTHSRAEASFSIMRLTLAVRRSLNRKA